ncbi:MAG: exosortase-associated EpsI family protein [Planctomycetota bacterium]|nr:exosortase-associated EpsI family protein [Planctomycetota bacterium]
MNQTFLVLGLAVMAIAGSTAYEGYRTNRWGEINPEELKEFTAKLDKIPHSFGDWTSEDSVKTQEERDEVLKAAGLSGFIKRMYTNSKTNQKVSAFIACGKKKDVIIHSPDQCYAASGFTEYDRNRSTFGEFDPAEFWGASFVQDANGKKNSLNIYWSWASEKGNWKAPDVPRMFYNHGALYKIYAISEPDPATEKGEPAAATFLKEFVPVANQALFNMKHNPDSKPKG